MKKYFYIIVLIISYYMFSSSFVYAKLNQINIDQIIDILMKKKIITDNDIKKIKNNIHSMEETSLIKRVAVPLYISTDKHLLEINSSQKYYTTLIRGYLHFDTRIYDYDSNNANTFDIRRARLEVKGILERYIKYRVQGAFEGTPYLRNAWISIQYWPWLGIRLGQYKPSFSTQWCTPDNNTIFLERPTSTPVYPFFDRGISLYGDLLNGKLTYTMGVFTGAGIERDQSKGDIDDQKDWLIRLFFTPFKKSNSKWIDNLHFVIEGTYGNESVTVHEYEGRGLMAQDYESRIWKWNDYSNTTLGQRYRYGIEIHWLKGPFFISNENLRISWSKIGANNGFNGHTSVYTLFGGYFLTGEKMKVSNWGWHLPIPKHFFNPHRRSWGAFCPTFSYSYTITSQNMFDKKILTGASYANTFVLGLNWLWSNMVRWHFNITYIHAGGGNTHGLIVGDYSNPTTVGTEHRKNEWMFGARMKFTM